MGKGMTLRRHHLQLGLGVPAVIPSGAGGMVSRSDFSNWPLGSWAKGLTGSSRQDREGTELRGWPWSVAVICPFPGLLTFTVLF